MATLFDQPARSDSLSKIMDGIQMDAKRFGFPEEMTPEEWHALCDLTRTALAIQSADVLDEQLAGFGEILQGINETLVNFSTLIETKFGFDSDRT